MENLDKYGRLFIAIIGEDVNGFFDKCDIPPRYKKLLRYRFGLDDGIMRTLEESSKEFGVTRERIRQMQAKGLEIIRYKLRNN